MRVYVISVRFESVYVEQVVKKLDGVMSTLGDWYRLNAFTWLLATDRASNDLREVLHHILEDRDTVLILKLDLRDYSGFAQKDVWDWLKSKMSLDDIRNSNNALSFSGRDLTGKK